MEQALDVLAFAPHPDDAEIGCGGSIALGAGADLRVGLADLTRAEMSTRGNPETRQREARDAAAILGVSERFNLGLPDTLVGCHQSDLDPVIELIRATRPRVVWAPYWQDRHPDHAAAGELVKKACFLAGVAKVGEGKPHRPQHLYHYLIHHPFEPSFVCDISEVWETKVAAIKAFASQFGTDDDGPDTILNQTGFIRQLEAKAVYFGSMIGAEYGEPFYSSGPVSMNPFANSTHTALRYSPYSP
jgi:N-acetylglucosamine malate deacetylase 1